MNANTARRQTQCFYNVAMGKFRQITAMAISAVADAVPAAAGKPDEPAVTISVGPETLEIQYYTKRSGNVIELSKAKPGVRSGWTVGTAGVALEDNALRSTDQSRFNTVVVTIRPDKVRIDRAYPQALRVGEGWLVHGPYFGSFSNREKVTVRVPSGWIATPRKPLAGHFFVGPRSYLHGGVVSPPGFPDAIRSATITALGQANASYAHRFAVTPPPSPLVILAADPTLMRGWRGDSTDTALSLRFADAALRQPPQAGAIGRFVAHEVFHDWWKGVIASLNDEKGAWVEEGMAEYAALLTSDDTAAVAIELTTHLNDCLGSLHPEGLLARPPTSGQAVYDCGVVFQWLRDLQWRVASDGHDDVFTGWSDLLKRYRRTKVAVEWQAAIAPPARFAQGDVAGILLLPTADRRNRLVAALNGLGARIVAVPDDRGLRSVILKHVLRSVCRGQMGFSVQTKSVKLDTGDRCGPLNGDPEIDAIAGHNLFGDPAGAFTAVASLCASGGPMTLQAGVRIVATLTCTRPVERPADRWSVEAWR